ncbi:MAG: hypothetical protein AB7I27_13510 [Bacteriovoracaceae bacterium]
MKKAALFTLFIYFIISIAHIILWPVNKTAYHRFQTIHKQRSKFPIKTLKTIRLELEKEKRQQLNQYRWPDQRKEYAQIPIERAFDYFIHQSKLRSKSDNSTQR